MKRRSDVRALLLLLCLSFECVAGAAAQSERRYHVAAAAAVRGNSSGFLPPVDADSKVSVTAKTSPFAKEPPARAAAGAPAAAAAPPPPPPPAAPPPPPPPPKLDYNDETPIVLWSDESTLPFSVETLIALAWVTMVAAMPLVVVWFEGGKTTQSQWITFVVMWIIFFGGILLFTNIILFQSAHFDHIRPLTVVECVYLLSQILTTVGYGDITPAKPRGQLFIGLYVVFSLLIIANVVSEVSDIVMRRTREYIDALYKESAAGFERQAGFHGKLRPKVNYNNLLKCLVAYLFFVVIGVLFFTLYPGEGKTLFQAIYMSIITLSTVGFGWFTPVTEAGKVFAAFWMLFGSASLVALVGAFTECMEQRKALERYCPKALVQESEKKARMLGDRTDLAGFLKFSLLSSSSITEEEIVEIEKAFKELRPDSKGTVSTAEATRWINQGHNSPRTHRNAFGLNPAHREHDRHRGSS